MNIQDFVKIIKRIFNCKFFVGVPDSQLKEFCNYIYNEELKENYVICANEGNCVAVAAGSFLATGNVPLVFLQNSGIGNMVNPATSLMHKDIFGIPCIYLVGWRGEPGEKDEPQHLFQGKITIDLFKLLEIPCIVIDKGFSLNELEKVFKENKRFLDDGKSIAIIIKKNIFFPYKKVNYSNDFKLSREAAIRIITEYSGEDPIISTTGKASRELFEIRETEKFSHENDFLTVGSMGHTSSIALGIALKKPDKKIWCLDGDGSAIMHMGSMAIVGNISPRNLIHIVLNNASHDSVGGMPTAASSISLTGVAKACGYPLQFRVKTEKELKEVLKNVKNSDQLCFIEVCVSLGSRSNLGRPTLSLQQNKKDFCKKLRG